jgi:hypothetical protein
MHDFVPELDNVPESAVHSTRRVQLQPGAPRTCPTPLIPNLRELIPTPQIFLCETRQYCKGMSSLRYHRGHMEAAAKSDSVAALVGQMHAELRDLMSRREDFARRIRYLRHVKRGLHESSSAPAFAHLCAEPASRARHKSVTASSPANRAAIGASGRHLRSRMQARADHVNLHLQRACRIALLEGEKPVSLEEICARIVRRGSFSFVNPDCANPVLLQLLNAMAERGEVHLLESDPCCRWERVAPLYEA